MSMKKTMLLEFDNIDTIQSSISICEYIAKSLQKKGKLLLKNMHNYDWNICVYLARQELRFDLRSMNIAYHHNKKNW